MHANPRRRSPTAARALGSLILFWLAVRAPAFGQTVFTDTFERPDGPVDGWTVFQGPWNITSGRLSAEAIGGDRWVWAGDPPFSMTGDFQAQLEFEFPSVPPDVVGRHGGLMFFASTPTQRGDPLISGYTIDWIDRPKDHGFRLLRVDNGVQVALQVGTPELAQPPLLWQLEVDGDLIRFSADGSPVFELADNTYREGHFGAWAYTNGTAVLLDEVEVRYQPVALNACLTASAVSGNAPLSVDFDAACSTGIQPITSYQWDFGDGSNGSGAQVTHVFQFADTYTVTLTVADGVGNTDTATVIVLVTELFTSFQDDFSRPPGPPDGWTIYQGEWIIFDEELVTTTAGAENWIWAGSPAAAFSENFDIRLDFNFRATPVDGVGRHGGVMFCATAPTWRYDGANGGYTIDWIDRPADHGFRLLRVDNAAQIPLQVGTAGLAEPPSEWLISVRGNSINFYGDGVLYLQTVDTTYRGGFFGLWGWVNGQTLGIDNIDMTTPSVVPCFTVTPDTLVTLGTDQTFDAGCSESTGDPITSYAWDFGDGVTSTAGAVVEHTYAAAGVYNAKLTVRTAGNLTSTAEQVVEAFVATTSFEDDFARADGPPTGWTVIDGDWTIVSEALHVAAPAAPEAWIWAGDPAHRFAEISSIEFDLEFLVRPPDEVGRHGGIFFFARNTQPRFSGNSGYTIDWIDRPLDLGYRFSRWDNGFETPLIAGTQDVEPGSRWRIEIEGDAIRLLADGELEGEVMDGTYRIGHVGFWSYVNGQEFEIDNVEIGGGGPPPTGFHRGDTTAEGNLNITDGVAIFNWLFLGGLTPLCLEAANANDAATINITTGVYLLNFLFLGGPAPPAPGPVGPGVPCGPDPENSPSNLGCAEYNGC